MKQVCLLLLLGIVVNDPVQGQNIETDSLRHLLSQTGEDTNRVLMLVELSNEYQFYRTDSAKVWAKQALQLARRLHYAKGEGQALTVLGGSIRQEGDLPRAMQLLYQGLPISRSAGDRLGEGRALNRIGNIYTDLGEYQQAIHHYRQAINALELVDDDSGREGLLIEYNNLATNYTFRKKPDSTYWANQQAYRLSLLIPRMFRAKSIVTRGFGMYHAMWGNADSALYYFRESIKASRINENFRNLGTVQYQMAEMFYKLKQPDSSLYYARKALADFKHASAKVYELRLSQLLTKLYLDKHNLDSAYYFKAREMAQKDSLYGPDKFRQLQLIVLTEQQRQQELLDAQKEYQNQVRLYALLAGLAVFIGLAFILYRNSRQQRRANKQLNEQKEKVEQTLTALRTTQTQLIQREKMASLGELTAGIAHEIQNPLNFVNNFSEVSVELIEELKDELAKGDTQEATSLADDLSQNLQRITQNGQRASNIVRGMLEHSRSSTGERLPTDLNALADEYLHLAHQGHLAKDQDRSTGRFNGKLETHFAPDLPLVNVVAQDLSRVLLNLFNNAFYAVGQKQKMAGADYLPIVRVSTFQFMEHVEIRVRDNGGGIPDAIKEKIFQPFFTTKPTGEGTGLGLSLSYDIVTQGHGGKLSVESQEGMGTAFIVILPIKS